jgi:iron(II)-dependent oxidoreductase
VKPFLCTFLVFFSFVCNAQTSEKNDMVLIPAGEFTMGKNSVRGGDSSPAHRVSLDSFYIDAHEVTNAEYLKFCKATGHRFPEFWNVAIFRCGEDFPDHPVVGVSWYDAMKYAEWAGKRLPTEAEWEYAGRGGLVDNDFPNGNTWDITLRRNDSVGHWKNLTVEVKSFEPNAYGLYDMGGNVWEWTMDIYQHDYYKTSPTNNPRGPQEGTTRVIRGGSWHSGKMCHRVFYRKGLIPGWVDFAVGFRCVKDI